MKTILLLLSLISALSLSFSQQLFLSNSTTNLVKQHVSWSDSTLISVPAGGGYVKVLWATSGTPYTPWSPSITPAQWRSLNPSWGETYVCVSDILTNSNPTRIGPPLAGRFSSGREVLSLNTSRQIDYVVVGWTDTNILTFDSAYTAALTSNSMVGVSTPSTMLAVKFLGCDDLVSPTGINASFPGLVLAPLQASVPAFYSQPAPAAQTVAVGSSISIHCTVHSYPPALFQWLFNGTNAVVDATNQILNLTNLHSWQSGAYTLVASNSAGVATSEPVTLSVYPTLGINMIPAITLNGDVGLTYKLEFISAVGPTNEWNFLASIMLTNNPQIYFDLSAIGQPQRLYRLVQEP